MPPRKVQRPVIAKPKIVRRPLGQNSIDDSDQNTNAEAEESLYFWKSPSSKCGVFGASQELRSTCRRRWTLGRTLRTEEDWKKNSLRR